MAERTSLVDKISCTSAACNEELHCFRPKASMDPHERGTCRECGADLVDWELAHARDFSRATELFDELPKELIRHHYWHVEIPDVVVAKASRYRPEVLADRTRMAVHSRVGSALQDQFRDGIQTPDLNSPSAQIYFMGMHAVAACCRKCIEYWHGIPADQVLDDGQEQYLTALVWLYVCQRMGWKQERTLVLP